MVKTITTSTGENTITFDEYYPFVWIKNMGESDVNAAAFSDFDAGDDNVTLVKAGEVACIQAYTKNVYVDGASTLELHAQNYAECPFRRLTAGSGGGSITIDDVPTQGSTNAVSSGGTYTAIQAVKRTTTALWTNDSTSNPSTITLSGDFDAYDELIIELKYTSGQDTSKQFHTIYPAYMAVGEAINLSTMYTVNGAAYIVYTITSKTLLTYSISSGDFYLSKIIGVKYGA